MFFNQEQPYQIAQNCAFSLLFLCSLVTAVRCLKTKNVAKPWGAFSTWRVSNKDWLKAFIETRSGNKRYGNWMRKLKKCHPLGLKARLPLLDVIDFLSQRVIAFNPTACVFENLEIISDVSSFSTLIFAVLDSSISQEDTKNLSDDEIINFYDLLTRFQAKFKQHASFIDEKIQQYSEHELKNVIVFPQKELELSTLNLAVLNDAQKLGWYIYAMGMKQYSSYEIDAPETVFERLFYASSTDYSALCDMIASYKKSSPKELTYQSETDFPTNIKWHQGFGEFFYRVASIFSKHTQAVAHSPKI